MRVSASLKFYHSIPLALAFNLDLTKYLKTVESSTYNLRHIDYSFKTSYARTDVLKFSYFHIFPLLYCNH